MAPQETNGTRHRRNAARVTEVRANMTSIRSPPQRRFSRARDAFCVVLERAPLVPGLRGTVPAPRGRWRPCSAGSRSISRLVLGGDRPSRRPRSRRPHPGPGARRRRLRARRRRAALPADGRLPPDELDVRGGRGPGQHPRPRPRPRRSSRGSRTNGGAPLERRNAELAARLTELEDRYMAVERFAGTAAHQLAEPLVIAESSAILVAEELGSDLDPMLRGRLDAIGRGAARARRLAGRAAGRRTRADVDAARGRRRRGRRGDDHEPRFSGRERPPRSWSGRCPRSTASPACSRSWSRTWCPTRSSTGHAEMAAS